jgi:ubiquinone/menaquinone biosynthesis C-methylase UbiE
MKRSLSKGKKRVMESMDKLAEKRDKYIKRNKYYYKDLIKFLKYNIPEGSKILEIGCGTGYILNSLNPSRGVGIDISSEMIEIAKKKYNHLVFIQDDAEHLDLSDETFDFIIISDTLGYLEDIQQAFNRLWKISHPGTRIIVTYHNYLWHPFLRAAEFFRLKMPQVRLNWLARKDIESLLEVEGFDIIKSSRRFLFPKFFPLISWFFNKYVCRLPLFSYFSLTGYTIARPLVLHPRDNELYSVSIIIPAKNEKENIEDAVKRIPPMGKHTEIMFVEGHSKDGTLEEIKRVTREYSDKWDIKYYTQDGKGKGDAVRKGFANASGDILMILDADLTVPPEDLPKFYNALAVGKGEFINGSRLVYPMEKDSMRTLNIIGNKFFSIMLSWILGQDIKDTLCGTKVISRKNWEKILKNRKYFGDFDPFGDYDLIFGASKLNLKFVEIPIRYRERKYGETQISRFRHGWLLLKMTLFAARKIKFY